MASPVLTFSEFSSSGISPSGSRHLTSHASYVGELSTTAGEFLDFGSVNNTNVKQHTETKALVMFVEDMKDANEAIFNMRFWLSDVSDFSTGTYFFNGWSSGTWIQNISLTDASGYFVSTSLPSGQNLFREAGGTFNRSLDGFKEITAANLDTQVTNFIYLSVSIDTDVSNGVLGGNSGGFVYRCTVDYR